MHAHDFQDLISKGDFASYENRVYLAGACNTGKSSLASILIGEEIPKKWHSTNGLVIHFGRNGIHLEDKKMIPLGNRKFVWIFILPAITKRNIQYLRRFLAFIHRLENVNL